MEIAGFIKTSLIDYPEKIAAVVFTQGCNFRCGFCHNPDLLPVSIKGAIPESEILEYLKNKKNVLDGVVITGGEPVMQKDLKVFINKIKQLGYLVKLDTNGSDPVLLKELITEGLIDYVAMDIKGPLEKYPEICSYVDKKVIQSSINIIVNSKIDSEFRTTLLPFYHTLEDIIKIGELIMGSSKYTIQGFRPKITYDKKLRNTEIFKENDLNDFAEIMRKYVKNVVVHSNY